MQRAAEHGVRHNWGGAGVGVGVSVAVDDRGGTGSISDALRNK